MLHIMTNNSISTGLILLAPTVSYMHKHAETNTPIISYAFDVFDNGYSKILERH